MIYLLNIKCWDKSNRIETRKGDVIGFLDNHVEARTNEHIFDLIHKAYEQGTVDGRVQKGVQIRNLLGI